MAKMSKSDHEEYLECVFNNINKKHFGNMLESVEIRIWRDIQFHTIYKYDEGSVMGNTTDYGSYQEISIADDLETEDVVNTLVHEMVHVYQAQHEGLMHHGKSFMEWKNYFKQYGYEI